jgi:mono/diheme cytochrome c family protein
MTWRNKTSLWLAVTLMLAAVAYSAAQEDSGAKAEKVMNTNCLVCHDLRTIQTQAMDAEGWTSVVNSMIEKGAKVEKADIPMLVGYLEDNFGPLPDGTGKEVVLSKCTVCHDLKRVRQHFASPEEWAETLGAMENEGLRINDEEYAILLRYLARSFRP